ncbi:CAP domain-containing protein [Robiginitalea sp. SC105]|uniref:CAP domain-containing protein n=1 Tax=Robiginitalea sp. SC105 TaxID=2762332 RepID=UPI00163A67BA|nr:CAP domain-containing protein [Robiginitalea sp. SC105]MBC2838034.1 CAP domain-containing protein [Robiginitalea sp. SC105]
MKMRMQCAFLLFILLAVTSCSKESVAPAVTIEAENVQAVEGALLQLVNEHRQAIGAAPLAFSELAYSYANEHTEYMIATGNTSHHDFNTRASKIAEAVDAKAVAENVAKDYDTAKQAFEGWFASPDHRSTMEGTFSHTAVSVKRAPDGQLYFTQLFYLQ